MKIQKKVIHRMNKCYSIAPLLLDGQQYFAVAAEKEGPCIVFDLDGKKTETVWEGPGGTMSMVQPPGYENCFFAIQQFYSPNDSKEARIVLATRQKANDWKVQTIVELPHVHRIDVIKSGKEYHMVAATICSGRDFIDDWSYPGKIFTCRLPGKYKENHVASSYNFVELMDGLTKNHGYWRANGEDGDIAYIASENGVFRLEPPSGNGEWKINQIIDHPTSDMVFIDLDGDGKDEMVTIYPFHGNDIGIYKEFKGAYQLAYKLPVDFEFGHGIWIDYWYGIPTVVAGHRRGTKSLFAIQYDRGEYKILPIDENVGPANVFSYTRNGLPHLVSANREADEVALYIINEKGDVKNGA